MCKLIGALAILLYFTASCTYGYKKPADKRTKAIPAVYRQTNDAGFSFRQDTLLYLGEKYSGHAYSVYPDGDSAFSGAYFNGLEEGASKRWYANGQLLEERNYFEGRKFGLHRGWWENGQPKFEYHFEDGEHHGELKEWYASGQLYRSFHYKRGYEEGSQKIWWNNGTIRANYVVRNGKKYGLIGLKLCINPHDSIVKK
jgi:MORN repeat variant